MSDIFTPIDIETNDDDQNPLEALVGEGKKFSSPEDLARGKLESDRFIAQLQNELAELRQEVTKKATIEEILTQIKSAQSQRPEQSPPQAPQKPASESAPEDIENLVLNMMERKEAEKVSLRNENLVTEKLSERFGAEAPIHLNKKARELNVTVEYLQEVARRSPQAFFRLTDLDQKPQAQTAPAPRSSVSTPPHNANGRDKAYYERLKAQDRTKYFSVETQKQLYKDMESVLKSGGTW